MSKAFFVCTVKLDRCGFVPAAGEVFLLGGFPPNLAKLQILIQLHTYVR